MSFRKAFVVFLCFSFFSSFLLQCSKPASNREAVASEKTDAAENPTNEKPTTSKETSTEISADSSAPKETKITKEALKDQASTNNCPTISLLPGPKTSPGQGEYKLLHDGLNRRYIVYIPKSYDHTKEVPLIFNFHGFSSNATQQVLFSQMNTKADKEGFIVVYPNGYDNAWNAGSCCRKSLSSKLTKDVDFVRKLLKTLQSRLCINAKRVYATGMSNGGFLSYRLACEASDIITAVAPVAGVMGLPDLKCNPSRPVPIIHFHGTSDPVIGYNGTKREIQGITIQFPGAKKSIEGWAKRNGCTDQPQKSYSKGQTECITYSKCKQGSKVTLCTSKGVGHCWPGQSFCPSGKSTFDIIANDAMWSFFKEFSRQ